MRLGQKMVKQRTSLYRHFDKRGRLLYVGVSHSFMGRLARHKQNSHWYWDIQRVEVVHYPDRNTALRAEARAIRTESPMHNKLIPPSPKRVEPASAVRGVAEEVANAREWPIYKGPTYGPRRPIHLGYLKYAHEDEIRPAVEAIVGAGVEPELIFSDPVGDEKTGLVRMLRLMQSPDAVLICDRAANVAIARSLFRDRGQTVKDISGRVWMGGC